jgi:hypothetical protein
MVITDVVITDIVIADIVVTDIVVTGTFITDAIFRDMAMPYGSLRCKPVDPSTRFFPPPGTASHH